MNQFVFESKQKTFFIGMMAIGILSMAITYFTDSDPLHTRFWTNYLHNAAFFSGIALLATFIIAALSIAWSGWHTAFKRIWEAMSQFLVVGIALMAVILGGVWFHYHHLYHWADEQAVAHDTILKGKAAFLNKYWFTVATVGFLSLWYWFARKFRALSIAQDAADPNDYSFPYYEKIKYFGAIFLPIVGFTSAAAIWQWIMSVDAHWYSTMFAWYTTASWFVSMICITVLLLMYLKSKGYYEEVTTEHFHDLGKFVFGFSVFWTYLWFSQYMLIWYANIGEETIYFHKRLREFPVLFYGNLVLNFVLPFLILVRNDTKRKKGSLIFVASVVLFGHWFDFFQMCKLGPLVTAQEHAHAAGHGAHEVAGKYIPGYTIPGFLEIGTALGFIGLFLYFVFNQLTKASLVPINDPYLEESLNHHVEMHADHDHHADAAAHH